MTGATPRAPVLGFVGWSGTGKTTLLARVLPLLCADGLTVGLIKHAHHQFDIDHPGKDSHTLREAGAQQVLVTAAHRSALITERPASREPRLEEELERLDHGALDGILVEGFRHERFPRVELIRGPGREDEAFLHTVDPSVIAVITERHRQLDAPLPKLDIDDPDEVAAFVGSYFRRNRA